MQRFSKSAKGEVGCGGGVDARDGDVVDVVVEFRFRFRKGVHESKIHATVILTASPATCLTYLFSPNCVLLCVFQIQLIGGRFENRWGR